MRIKSTLMLDNIVMWPKAMLPASWFCSVSRIEGVKVGLVSIDKNVDHI